MIQIEMLRDVHYYAPGYNGGKSRWIRLRKGQKYKAEAGDFGAVREIVGKGEFLRLKPGWFCFVQAPPWLRRVYASDDLVRELDDAVRFADSRGWEGLSGTLSKVQLSLVELHAYRATGLSPGQIDEWARLICDIRMKLGCKTLAECREKICGCGGDGIMIIPLEKKRGGVAGYRLHL